MVLINNRLYTHGNIIFYMYGLMLLLYYDTDRYYYITLWWYYMIGLILLYCDIDMVLSSFICMDWFWLCVFASVYVLFGCLSYCFVFIYFLLVVRLCLIWKMWTCFVRLTDCCVTRELLLIVINLLLLLTFIINFLLLYISYYYKYYLLLKLLFIINIIYYHIYNLLLYMLLLTFFL